MSRGSGVRGGQRIGLSPGCAALYARLSSHEQALPIENRALRWDPARRGSAFKFPTRTSTAETAID